MSLFKNLIRVFERELSFQEQLLGLLTKERVAIVKLNQEELDSISVAKERMLEEGRALEQKRSELLSQLLPGIDEAALNVQQIVNICPPHEGKRELARICDNLKRIASSVRDMNSENSALIRQSLGLIASTIAIMRSGAAAAGDLPTYTKGGALSAGSDDLTYQPRRGVSREA